MQCCFWKWAVAGCCCVGKEPIQNRNLELEGIKPAAVLCSPYQRSVWWWRRCWTSEVSGSERCWSAVCRASGPSSDPFPSAPETQQRVDYVTGGGNATFIQATWALKNTFIPLTLFHIIISGFEDWWEREGEWDIYMGEHSHQLQGRTENRSSQQSFILSEPCRIWKQGTQWFIKLNIRSRAEISCFSMKRLEVGDTNTDQTQNCFLILHLFLPHDSQVRVILNNGLFIKDMWAAARQVRAFSQRPWSSGTALWSFTTGSFRKINFGLRV